MFLLQYKIMVNTRHDFTRLTGAWIGDCNPGVPKPLEPKEPVDNAVFGNQLLTGTHYHFAMQNGQV